MSITAVTQNRWFYSEMFKLKNENPCGETLIRGRNLPTTYSFSSEMKLSALFKLKCHIFTPKRGHCHLLPTKKNVEQSRNSLPV